jgi:quercetin dioxygenase-like cupin family protein/DNA-binding XRE family transcriptional regulator
MTDPAVQNRPAQPEAARPAGEAGAFNLDLLGSRLRTERERLEISLRELARRIEVSPSLISQIERGLAMPSVSTLWLLATELGLTIDELFASSERAGAWAAGTGGPAGKSAAAPAGPVQRRDGRKRIRLAGGVVWERLTAQPDEEVEFLHVVYPPGAESCPPDSMFRHGGKEYAYVLSGRLGLQIGFESHELEAGDSVSFNAQMPHRLWAIGDDPAVAIWVVTNRTNDDRGARPA